MVLWFHQRVGLENRLIDYYENNGEGLAHYVKVMQEKGYIYGEQFLPHDANVRELGTGKSRVETLESLGVRNITVISGDISVEDGIEAVRNFLDPAGSMRSTAPRGSRLSTHTSRNGMTSSAASRRSPCTTGPRTRRMHSGCSPSGSRHSRSYRGRSPGEEGTEELSDGSLPGPG